MKGNYLRYLEPGSVWEARNRSLFAVLSVDVGTTPHGDKELEIRILNLETGKTVTFMRSVWETTSDIGWKAVA